MVRVAITGGAGQIAYSFIPLLCKGLVLGPNVPIELCLLDIEPAKSALEGVAMELQDSAYSVLQNVTITTDPDVAFEGAQVAVLLGGFPRKAGMERKDLIEKNVQIMKAHGSALERCADRNCKIVVVANPANTNCLVAMKYAPSIPRENFTALTRLDHDRMRGMLAVRLSAALNRHVSASSLRKVVIWGNHSSTQVPDASHAEVLLDGQWRSVTGICNDPTWMDEELVPAVQQRGAAVIAARKLSSALSAANAIAAHISDWLCGPTDHNGSFVSMGVLSDGNPFGVPDGLVFSMPVNCKYGKWSPADVLPGQGHTKQLMKSTIRELSEEKEMAEAIIAAVEGRGHL